MKHFIIFCTLLVSLVFCAACNSGDERDRYFEAPLPQEVKDYTYFKNGTYWVYSDSATGDIDSFFVFDSYNIFTEYMDDTGQPLAKLEVFQYFTKSSLDGFTYYYLTDLASNRYNEYPAVRILRVREKAGVNNINHFFHHPVEVGKTHHYGPANDQSALTLRASAATLTFLHTFSNVLVYDDTNNSSENNQQTRFFVAKNIGIVRKEIPATGRVWNLLRYHIAQ